MIDGDDGDDNLTVDFTGGDPTPAAGIEFNGGNEATSFGDFLRIFGTFDTQTITLADAVGPDGFDGAIEFEGGDAAGLPSTITFTGLEPVNAGNAANTILNLPAAMANDATLRNSANAGEIEIIDNGATFEDTIIPNPTVSLTVNLGDSGDALTIESLDAAFDAAVNVNGGAAGDGIALQNTTGTGPYTLGGGGGGDVFALGLAGSMDGITADVAIDGGGQPGDIASLDNNSGSANPLVAITDTSVTGLSAATVDYTGLVGLTVRTSDASAAAVNLESSPAGMLLDVTTGSSDSDLITLGSGGDMAGILGPVTLVDFGGTGDQILYDNSASVPQEIYALDANGGLTSFGGLAVAVPTPEFELVEIRAGVDDDDVVNVTPSTGRSVHRRRWRGSSGRASD